MYIFRRGDTFYYRRKLPKHIAESYSVSEIKLSLQTTDKNNANFLASILNCELEKFILFLRSCQMNEAEFAKSLEKFYMEARSIIINWSYNHFLINYNATVAELRENTGSSYELNDYMFTCNPNATDQFNKIYRTEAFDKMQAMLFSAGINVNIQNSPFKETFLAMWDSLYKQAYNKAEAGMSQLSSNTLQKADKAFQNAVSQLRNMDTNIQRETTQVASEQEDQPLLSKMIEQYIDEKSIKWKNKSKGEYSTSLEYLKLCIGDAPVNSLKRFDAVRAIKNLRKLPTYMNFLSDSEKEKGIEYLTALVENNPEKSKYLSDSTVNKHAGRWKGFYDWMIDNTGYLGKNIINDLYQTKKKLRPDEERRVFEIDEIDKLLMAFNDQTSKTQDKNIRKWIALLAVYTGGRINEIAQLYTSNIIKDDTYGIWYIDITDEKLDQSIKNKNSKRMIPIHDDLIKAGFLKYVDKVKKDFKNEDVHLWPGLKFTEDGGYGKPISTAMVGIIDKYVSTDTSLTFHSLRHTFADTLSQNNVGDKMIEQLMGHSSGNSETAKRYTKKLNLNNRKTAINILNFGLDFKKLKISLDYTK